MILNPRTISESVLYVTLTDPSLVKDRIQTSNSHLETGIDKSGAIAITALVHASLQFELQLHRKTNALPAPHQSERGYTLPIIVMTQ